MKARIYVIFTGMSKLSLDSQYSLRWKNEIRGSPKVLVGLEKSKDES